MDLVGSRGGIHDAAVGVPASRACRLTAGLSPRCSRSVVPSYAVRNRPRSCSTGITRSTEFIPIYSPQCLRGKEAHALADGSCTSLQSCPPPFLALTRVTVDELPRLVASFA